MKLNTSLLTRSEKILLVMYELSKGKLIKIRFEDIVVNAYKKFGSDFQLKGYPQYPDTGDIIHKPLYSELKKKGYVLSGGKYFSLTKKGLEFGLFLHKKFTGHIKKSESINKFSRSEENEIENILKSNAFKLFTENKKEEILDIDFYSYLGTTVRTRKYDFFGRLSNVEEAIESTESKNPKLYKALNELHRFLISKFSNVVDYFKNQKGGRI